MELYIFGRFQVRVGEEPAFEEALREAVTATRGEAGCLEIYGCRGVRGAGVYYLHSRWRDVEAFEEHVKLAHTRKFLGLVEGLLEVPREVVRTEKIF